LINRAKFQGTFGTGNFNIVIAHLYLLCIAAFLILGDTELTVNCAAALLERAPKYDFLLTAEAKSIPLVQEMARQNGDAHYIVARKGRKLYMDNPICVGVKSITTEKDRSSTTIKKKWIRCEVNAF